MPRSVGRWSREPLVQFLLIGGFLFGASALLNRGADGDAERVVRVSAQEVRAQASMWESRWQRPPTESELNGLVDQLVRERVLYGNRSSWVADKCLSLRTPNSRT